MSSWELLGFQELKESTLELRPIGMLHIFPHPNPELHKGHQKAQRNQMELSQVNLMH
jgi:hypothetical protein